MFDFYFSSVSIDMMDFLFDHHCCILLSQLNDRSILKTFVKKLKTMSTNPIKIFLDSGAFSAWTRGVKINVEDYINLINENKDYLEVAASVDCIPGKPHSSTVATHEEVIKSCEETWHNFLYMRSKMKDTNKLLYTFHVGEPWEFLKQALEYKDEHGKLTYIALGGLVGKDSRLIYNFIKEATQIIKESSNPDIKVHIFGVTNIKILSQFKITSADSTTWVKGAAYGNLYINGQIINVSDQTKLQNENLLNKSVALQDAALDAIKKYGFELKTLQEDYKERRKFNIIDTLHYISKHQYKECTKKEKINLF